MGRPFISVVTPFHNTAPYLAQCIESVLSQSYSDFEYLLVDNCSTDGSMEIAQAFARRDPRIRVIQRSSLLSQVQNYNQAVAEISEASSYCKIVQADDCIFPDCLQMMVTAFEHSESIGLVSSYWLKGNEVRGSGYPYPEPVLGGRDMARLYLRTGLWVFGSPTAVMYRSSIVKDSRPFYKESRLHEDTEKCMEILEQWDFGFVHQILSFSRADNESISSAVRGLKPEALDRYIIVQRYATTFLHQGEAAALKNRTKREYYRVLAKEALRGWQSDLWKYHEKGLGTLGESFDKPYLLLQIGRELLWSIANPGATITNGLRWLKRKIRSKTSGGDMLMSSEASATLASPIPPPASQKHSPQDHPFEQYTRPNLQ